MSLNVSGLILLVLASIYWALASNILVLAPYYTGLIPVLHGHPLTATLGTPHPVPLTTRLAPTACPGE